MNKGKEWLKSQVKDEERELKSVYDNYVPYEKVLIADDVNELINQLDEPEKVVVSKMEKVVIPQFIADWIEKNKNKYNIKTALGNIDAQEDDICDWVLYNLDTFARAWLDGYTIIPERNMQVTIKSYDKTELEIELPESEANELIEKLRGAK